MASAALIFDLIGRDGASGPILRVGAAADKTAVSTQRMTKSLDTAIATTAAAGAKMTKAFTLPFLAFAAVGVKNAVSFQKQMTLLRTAAGESAQNMAVISSGIKKVSSDTATSLHDLGEGMYVIAKAARSRGWTGADQLTILKAAAQGAKSEMVPLATATDALTTLMTDYHSKATDAVKVENQLVVASGLAKTSFDLFSTSLSNVSPIAAGLGVSMKEVLGSLATMTQHGVSPQQATENMRNLLFNLAGQNNIASQAMQQLGINTVDLAKNLGSRGLTGTLAIVDAALKAHTKNGMVVTDIHKAAALATQSLNSMLGAMTGKLRDTSSGLLKGKVGITDYTKFAKSLGGTAGASALQFLALYKNSLGFSNQLKSGKGTVSTSVQQYQKLLGGMTGAAVAMQISGKYAKDNAKNVAAVGAAADETGANVHGWALTQQTLSYKLQDASNKASLLATSMGQALLPALSKVADFGIKAFSWVSSLSSGQKQLLGWSAGILAAAGPVLSIGSRLAVAGRSISTFASNAVLSLGRFGTGADGALLRISGAMKGITAAIGGAAVGTAVGTLTANASTAVKAVGVLASAAAGAAIGSAGGGLGALIGGVAGGLSALATQYFGAGKAAHAAIKPTDDFTDALRRDGDQIGKNTEALVANKLEKSGAYDSALKLGVSQRTLTLAMMGNKTAMGEVQAAMKAANLQAAIYYGSNQKIPKSVLAAADASGKLSQAVGDVTTTLKVNKKAAENIDKGTGTYKNSVDKAAQSTSALAAKVTLTAGLLQKLAFMKVSPKIAADPSKARTTIAQLTADINAIKQSKSPTLGANSLAGRVAVQNLQKIINSLHGKSVPVHVTSNVDSAVQYINGKLSTVQGKSIVVSVGASAAQHYKASGGIITGPGTGTSDSIPARLSNGEFVVNARQTARNLPLLHAINSGAPGFKGGGVVNGISYTSATGYANAKARAAKADQSSLLSTVDSAIGNVGSAYSPKFSVADVGIARIRSQIGAAVSALNKAIREGLAGKYVAGLRRQISALTKLANQQLAALRIKVRTTDLNAIRKALSGSADDIRSAISQAATDMKAAGYSAARIKALMGTGSSLASAQGTLTSMKDYRSNVRSTLAGQFDSTQYGSVTDLLNGFSGATAGNNTYAKELNKLRGEAKGNKALTAYINDLASKGQTTTLATLAAASKGQLSQVGRAVAGYNSSLTAGSEAATTTEYGKSVAQQTDNVNRLVKTVEQLTRLQSKVLHATGKHAVHATAATKREVEQAIGELVSASAKGHH